MEIHLMPDRSIFAQAGIFIILLFAMSRLVFRPLQKIFLLRKSRTILLAEEARRIEAEAKSVADSCERIMEKAVSEARVAKEKLVQEGSRIGSEIRSAARKETDEIVSKSELKITKIRKEAEALIEKDVPRLAEEIVSKIMQ